jgi:hypothetical protein
MCRYQMPKSFDQASDPTCGSTHQRYGLAASRSRHGRDLWRGHESIETTHIYVEADLATKERALERIAPENGSVRRFKADDTLLAFLSSL